MKDTALLEQGRGAAWQGNAMGAAWARHAMCESSFTELHPFWLSLYLYHVFPYMPYSSTLKIEATGLLKMLVHFYQTIQLYIPEYSFS